MAGDSVQQIKERLSIVDVVSPYVELHKAGKNYKGKSPFTNEKTPSFYVSPDKGMYYCFSSSQGGDIFTFIQSMEGVDFKGALSILADKAGVELRPEDPKKRSERETGLAILEEATSWLQKQLPEHEDATAYLKDRGVTGETIHRWRLGYAPGPPKGGWRELRSHLNTKGYSDEQLLKTGLVKSAEGKEPYDVFRDRIMFPIFDNAGKPIAFSGRILSKDSEAPKYVNSPETEFFNKSEVLYGFDKAKQGIRQYDFSLIVEGQFDVVLAQQAGYTNTVAVSGTSLTSHHVGLLQRLSDRVVLALDADAAGVAAVKRAADLMLARGIDLKVARVPEGEDPADLIKDDPKRFKSVIGSSQHVIEFLLAVLKEEGRDARSYKLRVRDEVVPYLVRMQNEIDVEHFTGVIAAAIDTRPESVQLEVARLRESLSRPDSGGERPAAALPVEVAAGADIQTRMEGLEAYLAVAVDLIDAALGDVISHKLFTITDKEASELVQGLTAAERSELTFRIESQYEDQSERQIKDDLAGKVRELQLLSLRSQLRDKKLELSAAEREEDEKSINALLQEVTKLQKQLTAASSEADIWNDETVSAKG